MLKHLTLRIAMVWTRMPGGVRGKARDGLPLPITGWLWFNSMDETNITSR